VKHVPEIRAERIGAETCELAEGPLWTRPSRLTWVDIPAGHLHVADTTVSFEPARTYDVGRPLGAALPLATDADGWILAAGSGFAHLTPDGDVTVLAEPERDRRGVRMNDAKCDPHGRLWAGSMDADERPSRGSLFRVDLDGSVTRVLENLTVSNGIDWSPDGRTFYFADSGHGIVYSGEYDVDSGELGPLHPLIRPDRGVADGLTVDAEGMLWIALWEGSAVHRYDPSGTLLARVLVDAPLTTSCCLGGSDGRTLFITSAREGLTAEQLAAAPDSGRLCAVEVDVPGPEARRFRGALPAA
jgi:sugar lactone lactonase YvrE